MNVKGKFRGMTLLTELKKRGSISKIDFEKVSWYLENLDEVEAELARYAKAEAKYTDANERLQYERTGYDLANKRLKEENQKLAKDLSQLDEKYKSLSEQYTELTSVAWLAQANNYKWIAIAFLSAVVSIGLIVKEFFV